MNKDPLLSMKKLQVTFPENASNNLSAVPVVSDFSLDVHSREILALVGESGSGKSTTALAILGLIPSPGRVIDGKILFDGLDLLELDKDELCDVRGKRISMIFQDPLTALNPALTVGDQISEAYSLHNNKSRIKARKLTIELLNNVGIMDPSRIYDNYPHQLSGGLRQRAVIAMALICKPELLIADEPTASLDTTVQAQILDLLLELQEKFGMAILFISHNLALISQFADTVAVMYSGRIMEILPANDLAAGSVHPYTKNLMNALPSLYTRGQVLPAVKGYLTKMDRLGSGCPFSKRCNSVKEVCNNAFPPLVSLTEKHRFACYNVPIK